MSEQKFILVVEVGQAKTEYWTDESGDYDQEYSRQAWSHFIQEVEVSKNLRAEIDRHNDGDEDFSSWVLYVLDAKDRRILIDYTHHQSESPNETDFMDDKEKSDFFIALDRCRKMRERKYEEALRILEWRLGELQEPDNADEDCQSAISTPEKTKEEQK